MSSQPATPSVEFKVLGAGLPRTGTASLKVALEILGFGPCYRQFIDMTELFKDAEMSKDWVKVYRKIEQGEKVDLRPLVQGYQSGVDSPVSDIYIEMLEQFPNAKVVLTTRPGEDWIKSMNSTIIRITRISFGLLVYWIPELHSQRQVVFASLASLAKYGELSERTPEARLEEVKRLVPEDNLLIFSIADGWEPLCKFLGCPIPDVPFPRRNDTAQFHAMLARNSKRGLLRWTYGLGTAVAIVASLALARKRM